MIVGINCGHTVSGTVGSGAVGFLNESNETRRVGYKVMEHISGQKVLRWLIALMIILLR